MPKESNSGKIFDERIAELEEENRQLKKRYKEAKKKYKLKYESKIKEWHGQSNFPFDFGLIPIIFLYETCCFFIKILELILRNNISSSKVQSL